MSSQQNDAKQWVRSAVVKHLPRTARSYRVATYTGDANVNSSLGMQIDLQPFEGKVVEVSDEWILLKAGRTAEFFVTMRDLVDAMPTVGEVVRITPYARRGFDGRRLDAPRAEKMENGVQIKTYVLGEDRSPLPLDHDTIRCPELRDLIEQIEQFRSPDGVRRLAQVLVDAGGGTMPVAFVDPAPEDIIATPPSLKFRVKTGKADGWIEYRYDRGLDAYDMSLTDADGEPVHAVRTVFFDQIAEITVDWIDDGMWRIAKVEILKPAPARSAAA